MCLQCQRPYPVSNREDIHVHVAGSKNATLHWAVSPIGLTLKVARVSIRGSHPMPCRMHVSISFDAPLFVGGRDVRRPQRGGLLEMIILPFMLLRSFRCADYAKRNYNFFFTRALHELGDKIHIDA